MISMVLTGVEIDILIELEGFMHIPSGICRIYRSVLCLSCKGGFDMKKMSLILLVILVFGSGILSAKETKIASDLGVNFRLSAPEVSPGDIISIYVDINNPTEETYQGIPLFVIWSVDPDFDDCAYFWPFEPGKPWESWDIHYYTIEVPPGISEIEVVPPFVLKDSVGDSVGTLYLVAGMSNPLFTSVFGSVDWDSMVWHF